MSPPGSASGAPRPLAAPVVPLPPALEAPARVTGRIVQIKAHDAREVEAILATLHAAGLEPEDLEIDRADLEDVFLEIMQGETPSRIAA